MWERTSLTFTFLKCADLGANVLGSTSTTVKWISWFNYSFHMLLRQKNLLTKSVLDQFCWIDRRSVRNWKLQKRPSLWSLSSSWLHQAVQEWHRTGYWTGLLQWIYLLLVHPLCRYQPYWTKPAFNSSDLNILIQNLVISFTLASLPFFVEIAAVNECFCGWVFFSAFLNPELSLRP